MLNRLVDTLRRADLAFTARELQDILLLASKLDAGAPRAAAFEETPCPRSKPATPAMANEKELRAASEDAEKVASPSPEQVRLHAGASTGVISGNTLRVPGVTPLATLVNYRRALYPFMRRLTTARSTVLDEEATATHAIDTGVWIPVYRPARERWFDVTLLIEDSPSVDIWQEELQQLARTFRDHSGMRGVSVYRLAVLPHPHLVALPSGSAHNIGQLRRGGARHLILYATDGISSHWHDGHLREALGGLAAVSTVSILHLLPRRAWRHTALGEPLARLQAAYPGQPSVALHSTLPWWLEQHGGGNALSLPALSLDTADMAAWANAMHARGGADIAGWLVPTKMDGELCRVQSEGDTKPPAQSVAAFRHMVSSQAYDLAVFLSGVEPLTVPVMRLVMRAMLPNAGSEVLAQVMIGGLMEQLSSAAVARDEREYRFRPGLREHLASALRISEGRRIDEQLLVVGRLIAEQARPAPVLTAIFPSPDGQSRLSEWTLPFAEVSLRALKPQHTAEVIGSSSVVTLGAAAVVGGTLRILHLSDLHAGHDDAPWQQRTEFGPAWDENLRILNAHGQVDLLCLSGDLTWNGEAEHFSQLTIFLDHTLSILGLNRNNVFAVPGNHDMSQRSFKALISGGDDELQAASHNYRHWANSYLGSRHGDADATLDHWVDVDHNGVSVRVLEWGSAWRMLDSRSSAGTLTKLERMLSAPGAQDASMRIVISHVPLSAMQKRELVELLFQKTGVHLLTQSHYRPDDGGGWQLTGEQTTAGKSTLVSRIGGTANRARSAGDMQLLAFTLGRHDCYPVQYWQRHWSPSDGGWESGEAAYWNPLGQPAKYPPPPQLSPPLQLFIGRQAELDELASALQQGHPTWLSGAAGIGKTALALHLGTRFWSGLSIRLDASLESDWRAALMRATGAAYPPDVFYQRASAELRQRDILLLIDNVNSKQHPAIQLLASNLEGCAVLILTRTAPSSVPPTQRHLALTPLSDQDAHELVRRLAPKAALDIDTQRQLMYAAAGVPKLLVAALRKVAEQINMEDTSVDPALDGYRRHMAEAALRATKLAQDGNRKAGVVTQPIGSGISWTLLHYLEFCHQSLLSSYYIVLTDRVTIADQVRHHLARHSTSLPPILTPQSVEHLEDALNARETPCVLVTTIQKLAMATIPSVECVVIYFSLRAPAIQHMDNFPHGTLIVFAQPPLLSPMDRENFGIVIGSASAFPTPGSHAVHIERPTHPIPYLKRGERNPKPFAELAEFIFRDRRRYAQNEELAFTTVVVPSAATAKMLSIELQRQYFSTGDHVINAATKDGQHLWMNYLTGAQSSTTVFVVTSTQIANAPYLTQRVCYVCCKLPAAGLTRMLYQTGRRNNRTPEPIIVDLVGLDWPISAPHPVS